MAKGRNGKKGVPRHRTICRATANRLEKAIETRTRREGKRQAREHDSA